jgi:ferredoxin
MGFFLYNNCYALEERMAHYINDNCSNCGTCPDYCPIGAITPGDGIHIIDEDACIDCGACEDCCANDAIQIR